MIARFQIVFPTLHPVAYRSVQENQQFVKVMIVIGIIPSPADLQDKKAGTDCSDIRFSDKYLA